MRRLPPVERSVKPVLVPDTAHERICRLAWRCNNVLYIECVSHILEKMIYKEDQDSTAFRCHHGLSHLTPMRFGLKNSSGMFQRVIDGLVTIARWRISVVCVEDMVRLSRTTKEHINSLWQLMTILYDVDMTVSLRQCERFINLTSLLDCVILSSCLEDSTRTLEAICRLKHQISETELRSFVRPCNSFCNSRPKLCSFCGLNE